MKLRDHPLMSCYWPYNWPPVWFSLHNTDFGISRNEVGVLTEVRKSEIRTDGIVLIMKHNKNLYYASLIFPDLAFFNEIFDRMNKSIGLSIQDIGDINMF